MIMQSLTVKIIYNVLHDYWPMKYLRFLKLFCAQCFSGEEITFYKAILCSVLNNELGDDLILLNYSVLNVSVR